MHRWKVNPLLFFSVLCMTLKDPSHVSDRQRGEKLVYASSGWLTIIPYIWCALKKCIQRESVEGDVFYFSKWRKWPVGYIISICVFSAKECMLNSYLDKHQTDNKILQSWKGKEFIERWGLSCWLDWCWWKGRSLVVLGVRGQLLALNSCPKSSRDKDWKHPVCVYVVCLCEWVCVCVCVWLIPATGQIDTVKLDQLESYGSTLHVQQAEHI